MRYAIPASAASTHTPTQSVRRTRPIANHLLDGRLCERIERARGLVVEHQWRILTQSPRKNHLGNDQGIHGYAKGCRVRLHCCWARAAVQELCKPLATHPIRHRSHVAARKPSLPHPSYDDTFNKALAIATRWRSPPERVIPRSPAYGP